MELVQGDYIGIINSDDVYKKNAFDIIQKYIKLNPDVDFIFGSVKKHWGILYGYRPKKLNIVGVFTQVIQLVFLLKELPPKP